MINLESLFHVHVIIDVDMKSCVRSGMTVQHIIPLILVMFELILAMQ